MRLETRKKDAFAVIGKEGSTSDGPGFIQKLWADANAHFSEVRALAKRDEAGRPVGFWGAMSDCSRSFKPWEDNFSKGLYLAGVECEDGAQAPQGWTKWTIPGYEFMKSQGIPLAGAVQDFTCPATGTNYMLFPIRFL